MLAALGIISPKQKLFTVLFTLLKERLRKLKIYSNMTIKCRVID